MLVAKVAQKGWLASAVMELRAFCLLGATGLGDLVTSWMWEVFSSETTNGMRLCASMSPLACCLAIAEALNTLTLSCWLDVSPGSGGA